MSDTPLRRKSRMLLGCSLGIVVCFAFARVALADITLILEPSPPVPLPQGNLAQYTVSAMGIGGHPVDSFGNPQITPLGSSLGVHNVAAALTNHGTPTRGQHTPGLFEPAWAAYDTYFFTDHTNSLSIGPNFSETNDESTTGTLGLTSPFGAPRSGFGTYNSEPSGSKHFTMASSNLPFMQVVLRAEDSALLRVRGLCPRGGGCAAIVLFSEIVIGPALRVGGLNIGEWQTGSMVTGGQLSILSAGTDPDELVWSLDSFSGDTGAVVDPVTGVFTWDSRGAAIGSYNAVIRATNSDRLFATGELRFDLIPEPATMTLFGLAMIGLVGFARRRG